MSVALSHQNTETMDTVADNQFLLIGSESFQEASPEGSQKKFSSLEEILNFLRNMKFQKEYFEILDLKSGRNINWSELN